MTGYTDMITEFGVSQDAAKDDLVQVKAEEGYQTIEGGAKIKREPKW